MAATGGARRSWAREAALPPLPVRALAGGDARKWARVWDGESAMGRRARPEVEADSSDAGTAGLGKER